MIAGVRHLSSLPNVITHVGCYKLSALVELHMVCCVAHVLLHAPRFCDLRAVQDPEKASSIRGGEKQGATKIKVSPEVI